MTANSSDYGRLFFQAEVFRAGRLSERRARPSWTGNGRVLVDRAKLRAELVISHAAERPG